MTIQKSGTYAIDQERVTRKKRWGSNSGFELASVPGTIRWVSRKVSRAMNTMRARGTMRHGALTLRSQNIESKCLTLKGRSIGEVLL